MKRFAPLALFALFCATWIGSGAALAATVRADSPQPSSPDGWVLYDRFQSPLIDPFKWYGWE